MDRSRGSVLILALWAVSILTVFTVTLGFQALQKSALLARLETLSGLYPVALSGIEAGRGLIKQTDDTENLETRLDAWFSKPAAFLNKSVGNGFFTVSYSTIDEAKKVHEIYGLVD